EGAFPRTRWPDDAGDGPGRHLQVDAFQHLDPAEVLPHAAGMDHHVPGDVEVLFQIAHARVPRDRLKAERRAARKPSPPRLSLRLKWASRKCWPIDMMVTTARYQKATTISRGMVSKVRA